MAADEKRLKLLLSLGRLFDSCLVMVWWAQNVCQQYPVSLLNVYSLVLRALKYQKFFLIHLTDISSIIHFPGCELSKILGIEVKQFESWLGH